MSEQLHKSRASKIQIEVKEITPIMRSQNTKSQLSVDGDGGDATNE